MRRKKILAITLILCMFCFSISSLVEAASMPVEYNLQDVIEGVIAKNSDLRRLDGRIKIAEDKWIDADHNRTKASGYMKEMNEDVYPLRALINLDDVKWERKIKQDEVENDAIELYYKIILQEKLIDYQKLKIERLQKQVEYKKIKISAGTEASYTLINDETALKEAETELQRLINDEKNMKIQLNIKMGNEPRKEIILKDSQVPFEEYSINDINGIADSILKNYYTLKSIDKKIDVDTAEKAITESYKKGQSEKGELRAAVSGGVNYKSAYDALEDDLLKLKYDKKDEQDKLELKLRTDYNSIMNLKDEVTAKKLEYDKDLKISDAELAKFKAGQNIELDYKRTQEDAKYALVQCEESKLNYYMSVKRFKDFIKYIIK